jgi:hypothetical protein
MDLKISAAKIAGIKYSACECGCGVLSTSFSLLHFQRKQAKACTQNFYKSKDKLGVSWRL